MLTPRAGPSRLRVWQIAELYPPDYGGGAAIYVRDISHSLVERGHEVRVLCTEDSDRTPYTLREETLDGVRVERLCLPHFRRKDPGGWLLGIRGWLEHCRRIDDIAEAILRDWHPDIVNFHTPYSLYEECLPAIKRRSAPIVGLPHCGWLICPRLGLMRSPANSPCDGPGVIKCLECLYSHWDGSHAKAVMKLPWRLVKLGGHPAFRLFTRYRARGQVSGLLATSDFIRRRHEGRVPGVIAHIPLGVDLGGVPSSRPLRPRTPFRFGFAGGFQAHKGIWQVLDAAAGLRRSGLPFELRVWGPTREADVEQLAIRGLRDCVIPIGVIGYRDRWTPFSEIDALVMATEVQEAFGRVLQEASAAGAPSVAPAIGGIAEQIRDGVDGLLYHFRDTSDLERQMARLLTEPGLYTRLRENLWRVIDTRDAVAAVEAFYREIIRRHANRAETGPSPSSNAQGAGPRVRDAEVKAH